jgi:hypothetical protein
MKNLPCIVTIATLVSLAFLAAAAACGVPLPYASLASDIIGFSCCAGVVAFFAMDYSTDRSRNRAYFEPVAAKREVIPATVGRARNLEAISLPVDTDITINLMATLGSWSEPATVSLM